MSDVLTEKPGRIWVADVNTDATRFAGAVLEAHQPSDPDVYVLFKDNLVRVGDGWTVDALARVLERE